MLPKIEVDFRGTEKRDIIDFNITLFFNLIEVIKPVVLINDRSTINSIYAFSPSVIVHAKNLTLDALSIIRQNLPDALPDLPEMLEADVNMGLMGADMKNDMGIADMFEELLDAINDNSTLIIKKLDELKEN
jgi:hypothetical protein